MGRARGSARLAVVAAVAAVLAALTGCASTEAGGGGRLHVLAAASLTTALSHDDAAYNFTGSNQIVTQLEERVPADVVVTADERTMDQLVKGGLVEPPVIVATTSLAIVVQAGNPERVQGLADLARVDVVLADPAVPIGKYAADALGRAGVTVKPKTLALNVEEAVSLVATGEVDAAIAYRTARAEGLQLVEVPAAQNVVARYPAAVVKAGTRQAEAQAFVDALPARLQKAGFDKP